MTSDEQGREKWEAAAELRQVVSGETRRDPEAHPHAGVVDNEVIERTLSVMRETFDPEIYRKHHPDNEAPTTVEGSATFDRLLSTMATRNAGRAVRQGKSQEQSYLAGTGETADLSTFEATSQLREMILSDAPIIYLFGEPGSGKSNTGVFLSQFFRKQRDSRARVLTNIRSYAGNAGESVEWVQTFGELKESLRENVEKTPDGAIRQREDSKPTLFLFDEASQHASGRAGDANDAQMLGKLVYLIRKHDAGIVTIGHDGRDVHPSVREMATIIRKRRSDPKPSASVFETVRNRKPEGHIMDVTGIPDMGHMFNHTEATSWSFEQADESRAVEIAQLQETMGDYLQDRDEHYARKMAYQLADDDTLGLSQREIGEVLGRATTGEPFRQQWVSKWAKRFREGNVSAPEMDVSEIGQ